MQTRFCDGRCIETAFESEPGFFRCVIKSTDNEVFAVVSLRTPRHFFVRVREPLDNFRPRNVCSKFRSGENPDGRNPSNQSPKRAYTCQQIKTSRSHR